jgi:hypothetical protein
MARRTGRAGGTDAAAGLEVALVLGGPAAAIVL